jgi:hypothetical protein
MALMRLLVILELATHPLQEFGTQFSGHAPLLSPVRNGLSKL